MNFIFFTSLLVVFTVKVIALPEVIEPEYANVHSASLQKRAAPREKVESTAGYKRPANPNSTEVASVAKRIMTKFNADRIWDCRQKLRKIFGGTTQVITGLRTELDLEICTHACRGEIVDYDDCKNCTVEVWERKWENYFEVISFGCSDGVSNVVRVE
ncbi:onchocystatin-like isoform X2 [Planococcus citri]